MTLHLETPPEDLAVSLSEAKQHLRVTVDTDDVYISDLLLSAQEHAGAYMRRAVMDTTYVRYWPAFPAGREPLALAYPPFIELVEFKYIDADGAEQTLVEGTDFVVEQYSLPARLHPVYGSSWPTARSMPDSVWAKFKAGHAAAADAPSRWKRAILLLVGHWYENREEVLVGTVGKELPVGAKSLLRPYRVPRL